ncbi:hypothetical protein BDD12DRAFT_812825, partial [Trichophaea hybrida]
MLGISSFVFTLGVLGIKSRLSMISPSNDLLGSKPLVCPPQIASVFYNFFFPCCMMYTLFIYYGACCTNFCPPRQNLHSRMKTVQEKNPMVTIDDIQTKSSPHR